MSVRLPIPLYARDCEGHFPDRAIVPGVVLLARAAAVLAACGIASSLNGIRYARLRQLVAPDDKVFLKARRVGDEIRIDLERNDALVVDAQFTVGLRRADTKAWSGVGSAGAGPNASSEVGSADARAKALSGPLPETAGRTIDLDALLPHRPPMRWLREVVEESDQGMVCAASIPSACALAMNGDVPAVALVEAAAQSAALWEALRRSRVSGKRVPRTGYLVSMRDVEWFEPGIEAERSFIVSATLTASMGALTHYAIRAVDRGATLLSGSIGTMLVGEAEG